MIIVYVTCKLTTESCFHLHKILDSTLQNTTFILFLLSNGIFTFPVQSLDKLVIIMQFVQRVVQSEDAGRYFLAPSFAKLFIQISENFFVISSQQMVGSA